MNASAHLVTLVHRASQDSGEREALRLRRHCQSFRFAASWTLGKSFGCGRTHLIRGTLAPLCALSVAFACFSAPICAVKACSEREDRSFVALTR